MSDTGTGAPVFGVETITLDLPPFVGALSRRLHDRGMPVTPGHSAAFARALALVRPVSRRRLYWTARAVFVSDPGQVDAFDDVFFSVFGAGAVRDELDPDETRTVRSVPDARTQTERESSPEGSDSLDLRQTLSSEPRDEENEDVAEVEVPLALASDEEQLGRKSFDALEPHELAQLYRLMARLELATPLRRTRRYEKGRHGERVDMRRTLRRSLHTAGDPIRLARRRRRLAPRRLVMLCDISGSMEPYARAYLQFLTCAAATGSEAEVFVFATRLTRLTRALASRDPERAIQAAAAAAPDWSSGTRIGDALQEFNDRHGRRGMARGAVVVILSDGWERGDPTLVGRELERLARLAHRIVWVNPRVSADAFSVQSGGMVAALPHIDALVSGHSFEALGEVVDAIGRTGADEAGAVGMRWSTAADGIWEEDWGSATPVPGSSVAMPSGHGPRRGNVTPGWATDDEHA